MSLSVKNLFKRYGNIWALKDVSFEAVSGEITGIFGSNASGKTTLLKVLAGNESSSGGTISFDDEDVTKLSPSQRDFSLHTESSPKGLRSVFRPAETSNNHDLAALEKAIDDADRVLLLDEPFRKMDDHAREAFGVRIRQIIKDKNLTIIIATARYEEIFNVCDRVAVLTDLQIRQQGTPQEVYDRPASVAVATIVGRNNIFDSRRLTSSKSDHPEFLTLEGEHRLFAEKADIKTLGAITKNVSLAIRPENISISFGASFPEDNLLKAVVRGVKPRGPSTLVELDSNGLKLEAMVLRLVGLNIGDECMIGLPPDRIQVLPD